MTRFNMYRTGKLAVVMGLMTLAAGVAGAQGQCPVLKGTYAFTFSGTLVVPGAPAPAPYSGVGLQTFDGAGKWTATESANFNGFVVRAQAFGGTYTVNPDCTGTMTAVFANGAIGVTDFVVAGTGKTIYGIGVDDAGTLAITFTKVD